MWCPAVAQQKCGVQLLNRDDKFSYLANLIKPNTTVYRYRFMFFFISLKAVYMQVLGQKKPYNIGWRNSTSTYILLLIQGHVRLFYADDGLVQEPAEHRNIFIVTLSEIHGVSQVN